MKSDLSAPFMCKALENRKKYNLEQFDKNLKQKQI